MAFERDDSIVLASTVDKKQKHVIKRHDGAKCIKFSPDSETLATSAENEPFVQLWDVKSGKLIRNLEGHDLWVTAIQFTSDSYKVVTGSIDRTVRAW